MGRLGVNLPSALSLTEVPGRGALGTVELRVGRKGTSGWKKGRAVTPRAPEPAPMTSLFVRPKRSSSTIVVIQ